LRLAGNFAAARANAAVKPSKAFLLVITGQHIPCGIAFLR
jgi:hypothetical protein